MNKRKNEVRKPWKAIAVVVLVLMAIVICCISFIGKIGLIDSLLLVVGGLYKMIKVFLVFDLKYYILLAVILICLYLYDLFRKHHA